MPPTSTTPPTSSSPWIPSMATAPSHGPFAGFPRNDPARAQSSNAVNSAAAAASSLDPQGQTSTEKSVGSAFEMLGLQAPHLRQPQLDQGERFIQAITGEKKNIPSWSGQPNTMRSWLKLLAYWESETSLPRDRWGLRLYQGYGMILTALMAKYRPYLEVAGPTSIDKFFYTGERSKNETFSTYVAAKEVARQEMENHLQERLCERVAGRVLLRHANLSEWQRELMALREQHQLLTFDQIATLLRPLDRPELLAQAAGAELGAQASKHYPVMQHAEDEHDDHHAEEEDDGNFDESSESELPEGELLFEDREYEEDEAMFIQAYHSAYADVRKGLNSRRKERGFVRRKSGGKEQGRGGKGFGKRTSSKSFRGKKPLAKGMMRGSADDLQSRTRCFNCQQLGHYARDCPLKGSGKGAAKTTTKQAAFVICRGSGQPASHFMTSMQLGRLDKVISVFAGVQVSGAEALVDTAAEDAVVGERAMALLEVELRRHGLQVVSVPAQDAIPCAGIGGQAKIKRIVDAPVGVAGIHGFLRFTVLADTDKFQTPPLLPISFLEAVGAIIDLSSDCLRTPDGHEAKMTRLPSGHRSVNILEFGDSAWRLPSAIQDGNDPFRVVCVQAAVKSQFQGGEGDEGNAAIPLSTAATSSNFTVEDGTEGNEPDEHAAVWATLQENGIEDRARILLEHADFSAEAMEDILSMVSFHGKNGRDVLVSKRKDAGAAAFGIYVHGNMCGITTWRIGLVIFA